MSFIFASIIIYYWVAIPFSHRGFCVSNEVDAVHTRHFTKFSYNLSNRTFFLVFYSSWSIWLVRISSGPHLEDAPRSTTTDYASRQLSNSSVFPYLGLPWMMLAVESKAIWIDYKSISYNINIICSQNSSS